MPPGSEPVPPPTPSRHVGPVAIGASVVGLAVILAVLAASFGLLDPAPSPSPSPVIASPSVIGGTETGPPSASPTPTGSPTAVPSPTKSIPPLPTFDGPHLVATSAELRARPMTGPAWRALKDWSGRSGRPDISDQSNQADLVVLAKALVYGRTHSPGLRKQALTMIRAAVGTERGGRTLALGRNLPGYVIAADIIDLPRYDPAFDRDVFRPWLTSLLSEDLDGRTLRSTQEDRPNNWGTHAGAARAAVAIYLGDAVELDRVATVFRGYLGDRSAYAEFRYGNRSWQCDQAAPVGVNPVGCRRAGHSIDGVLPDDQRRAGGFRWPPPKENYVWEALQGVTLEAELLTRAGYPAWDWGDKAILRAVTWLYRVAHFPAQGDDSWQPWLVDRRYGTRFHGAAPTSPGKNFGFTDWLYSR
ncbi:MAG: alginate lyase family protein [Chloroflexota bacterium]|nr:alginate lyase family protein [Chloroflexota bacterium]